MVREGDIPEAEERLNRLLHSYPSSISLKFSAVVALSWFEMSASQRGTEDKSRWTSLKKELCQAIKESGNPAYYLPSVSMLVSLSLEENELEKAEMLLKENQTGPRILRLCGYSCTLRRGSAIRRWRRYRGSCIPW